MKINIPDGYEAGKELGRLLSAHKRTSQERKPMTVKEIRELGESFRNNRNPEKFIDFARAIEKHHGITEDHND